jgi:hypothetical protein
MWKPYLCTTQKPWVMQQACYADNKNKTEYLSANVGMSTYILKNISFFCLEVLLYVDTQMDQRLIKLFFLKLCGNHENMCLQNFFFISYVKTKFIWILNEFSIKNQLQKRFEVQHSKSNKGQFFLVYCSKKKQLLPTISDDNSFKN